MHISHNAGGSGGQLGAERRGGQKGTGLHGKSAGGTQLLLAERSRGIASRTHGFLALLW